MIEFGSAFIIINKTWPQLKVILDQKLMSLQYEEDTPAGIYELFAVNGTVVYRTIIYTGTVPSESGVAQATNDQYKSDFESNYKNRSNYRLESYLDGDPRWVFRLGNMVATGSTEQLVASNAYFEPQSQAQRSVVSTSANDAHPAGSGARAVRITYLNSNYVKKIEEINLNGTTPVSTVNTDIRFIERFEVIRGTAAVGRVFLRATTSGGEVCSIGAASTEAFLCHHYTPSGSRGEIIEWDCTVSDDALLRLKAQRWFSGSLVDPVYLDLENLVGIASGSTLNFTRNFRTMPLQEKTRVYITAQPQQNTQTTVRARLNIWEDAMYVSGSS